MRDYGKAPDEGEGYAESTVYQRAYRIDRFYRWVWDYVDAYTTAVTPTQADAYCRHLATTDHSQNHRANTQKAIKSLFKWHRHQRGGDEWDPEMEFTSPPPSRQPRDYFSREERRALREASLGYGTVPHYKSLDPEQREQWKRHLAQRFGIPTAEVTPATFDRANGWKIPSLVQASLDCGLRPKEVGRARISWVDIKNNVLRIPPREATKSDDAWTVAIQSRTAQSLQRWLTERECYVKYEDSDRLWLTREGNPYGTDSLNYLLERLCIEAEIDTEYRDLSWYSIRHSVGTHMTDERDLEAARVQLRHQSRTTTMKYDAVSEEDRRDALDKMG
jgi:site-specific recombinase XerD